MNFIRKGIVLGCFITMIMAWVFTSISVFEKVHIHFSSRDLILCDTRRQFFAASFKIGRDFAPQ